MAKRAERLIAVLAICLPLVLTGCMGPKISHIDWGAHAYEYKQRGACRAECRFSAYADGVSTECYGDCMLKRGFFCYRDFRGPCFDTTGTGIAESCVPPLDNFECRASKPLPEEYRPGGSMWKAHKEHAKCVEDISSFFDTSSFAETMEEVRQKCGHLQAR